MIAIIVACYLMPGRSVFAVDVWLVLRMALLSMLTYQETEYSEENEEGSLERDNNHWRYE